MSQSDSAAFIAGYPLKAHNTFGFDVRAQFACRIEREEQLMAAVRDPRAAGLPRLVLGGGSNVVLTGDFDGVVLLIALQGRRVVREDDDAWYVEAAGGEPGTSSSRWTLSQGLPGLENLALIPGTVGAAPIQNIGAYGLEMCERFASLRAVELATGDVVELDARGVPLRLSRQFFQAGRARPFRDYVGDVPFAEGVAAACRLRGSRSRTGRQRPCRDAADRAGDFRCGGGGAARQAARSAGARQCRQFLQESGGRRGAVRRAEGQGAGRRVVPLSRTGG